MSDKIHCSSPFSLLIFEQMKKISAILLLFFCLSWTNANAQEIDSLLILIENAPNDSAKAANLNKLAWKYMFSKPDTSTIISTSALTAATQAGNDKLIINALNGRATSYAVMGEFDRSLFGFREAEAMAKKIDDPNELAMVQNNIGLVFWNQGKLQEAVGSYKQSLDNFAKLGELKVGSANAYNNLGLLYNDLGKSDSALISYTKALEIFDSLEIENRGVANTYNNIGIIYKEQGNLPNALDYYLKALKVYESIDDQSEGFANTLNNIGIIYKEQKEYSKALEYYEKATAAFKSISENSAGLANTMNNIGIVYRLQNQEDKALEFYHKALEIQENLGEKSIGMASSLTNIGTIKESQGKKEEAIKYFEDAFAIQKEIGDAKGIANSLFFIGNLNIENKQLKLGIEQCQESLDMAKELGLLEVKMKACDCLADAYERMNNSTKAYSYFKQFIAYRDSLNNQENTRAITQKAMNYEFEKIQYQDSLQRAEIEKRRALEQREKDLEKEAEIQRQRVYTVAGGVGFILMLGLAFVLFRGYKNKQKANEIITAQKEEVEAQKKVVEEQKTAVEEQKEIIEEKNREIVDSISYAKRIQSAILPSESTLKSILPEAFVLFEPKDIVSGDFYWVDEKDGKSFFAAVDCTGHGVPGAMVSVVGHNGLNRVLNEFGIQEPAKMLDKLNELVEQTFESSTESVKDGMDMAICVIDRKKMELQFAGANNPLYLIRDGELIEYKADKQPIGKFDYRKPFTNHVIELKENDSIYIFSDGFADQFGGEKGKKFMYKPFKRLLSELSSKDIPEQKERLLDAFYNWKGELEQIDDVCVFGVRI